MCNTQFDAIYACKLVYGSFERQWRRCPRARAERSRAVIRCMSALWTKAFMKIDFVRLRQRKRAAPRLSFTCRKI